MLEWLTAPNLSMSMITLVSLLVNAVTIFRWVTESREKSRLNDQAFHMVMGLAHASTKRANMIVKRINALQDQGKSNEESMIFLENMYSDTKSTIESLLAAAKALKPDNAANLPFDGDALLNLSRIENRNLDLKAAELENKIKDLKSEILPKT